MNKYKFKFPTVVWILIAAVIAICTAGLIWNIFNLVDYLNNQLAENYKIAIYLCLCALTIALIVFVIAMAIDSSYYLKNGYLYCRFGLVYSKYEAQSIVKAVRFLKSNSLACYFTDDKYTVIVIDEKDIVDFVADLKNAHPQLCYECENELE